MVEATATVKNKAGIHCRPSSMIIKALNGYPGEARATSNGRDADLHSVFEIMALGLLPGDEVTVQVSGPDEEKRCSEIIALFETHFDFPPLRKSAHMNSPA